MTQVTSVQDTSDTYFASCPVGWEGLLKDEALALHMTSVSAGHGGIYFTSTLQDVYRYYLYSHLASKVFYPLSSGRAASAEDIYEQVYAMNWPALLVEGASIRVDFGGTNENIRNTQFGAQKVKDAICDKLIYEGVARPSVEKNDPDVRIHARLHRQELHISLDLCGESLHKRGYRLKQGAAPLKESLAAAILVRSGFSTHASAEKLYALVDPMCGSGTFLIEAVMMTLGIAPGLTREHNGFSFWPKHDTALWAQVLEAAMLQKNQAIEKALNGQTALFFGSDSDTSMVDIAKANVESAGLSGIVSLEVKDIAELENPAKDIAHGMVIVNPPYGERLGEVESLRDTYKKLAENIKAHFEGWQFSLFTSNAELAGETRLRAIKKNKFRNGALQAELFLYNILSQEQASLKITDASDEEQEARIQRRNLKLRPLSEDAKMVYNRIKKNLRRLKSKIKRDSLSCYRVYDADMPEFSAAIDVYNDCYHIQEYAAPKTIDEKKASYRFEQIKHAVAVAFDVEDSKLFIKTRRRNKGSLQYEKNTQMTGFNKDLCMQVTEGQCEFYVNLENYLDTGLFLDHRPLRKLISSQAKGKHFLNLFCYTATASVHASLGGAARTVSVDMSNTYLDWAEENFRLNNMRGSTNDLERADVFQWIKECRDTFDIIMLDPPTFSNSKKMDSVLDIQRDHSMLIDRSMRLLNEGGKLYFSTNFRKFKLDNAISKRFTVENISAQTIDEDFKQNPKIHYCWLITATA